MKPTIKLIMMMVVCCALIAGYAMLPEKPRVIGDWGFRQIPLRRLLTDTAPGDSTIGEFQQQEIHETDTVKKTILFFGDSMVGTLCYRMSEYAEQNGHKLICASWVSSSTHTWAKSDKIEELLNEYKPTYIFISLGSNELYTKDMDALENRVKTILRKCGDVPIVWIGPPNWCEDYGLNDLIKKIMGTKAFFPSYELTYDRQEDGHHPTSASSKKWMDAIAKWMNDGNSLHPILMDIPDHKKGKMKLIVIPPENGGKGEQRTKDTGETSEDTTIKEDTKEPVKTKESPKTEEASPAAPAATTTKETEKETAE